MDAGQKPPRERNEQPPSVDFIDNHAHEYHEAFANLPTRYDSRLGKYRPEAHYGEDMSTLSPGCGHPPRPQPPTTKELKFWEHIFPLAMNSFKAMYPKEPNGRPETGFSIRTLDTWDAVHTTLQDAQITYENPTGTRGVVKKGFRRALKHSQPLEQVLSLVPDIDYISPVTGILEIVIRAAKRSIQVRVDIANGLDKLEQHFGDIDTYLKIFSKDENIVRASVRLVSSILKAVEDIISYFLCCSASKAFSALFNGEEYKRALSESLDGINQSGQDLLDQARSSNMWQNHQTLHTSQHNSFMIIGVLQKQKQIADMQNELKSCMDQLLENMENERREKEEKKKLLGKQAALPLSQLSYHNTYVFPTIQQGELQGLTREDMLNLLDTPAIHITDIEHILRTRELIPNDDRARTERLLTTRRFRSWIVEPSSQELLIHGDFNGTLYVSGLSWLCCYLLQALQQTRHLHSLTFFCGRHLDTTDAHTGGYGIIRSLLSQLLQQQQQIYMSIQPNSWKLVQAGDIQHLCLLFESILRQFPPDSVVFCIIDGIKYYERDEYLQHMSEVLRFLLDLTQGGRLQCVFKILVTSPSPTTVVRHAFDENGIISMASLPNNADHSSSSRIWRNLEEHLG
ncbi:hypothetical protein F4859DRAFT_486496 [Xylaria cf. heliscus]|nr:hypothetical protein F4859DRAFT_486496 [Xylaria cf. heliscus]